MNNNLKLNKEKSRIPDVFYNKGYLNCFTSGELRGIDFGDSEYISSVGIGFWAFDKYSPIMDLHFKNIVPFIILNFNGRRIVKIQNVKHIFYDGEELVIKCVIEKENCIIVFS